MTQVFYSWIGYNNTHIGAFTGGLLFATPEAAIDRLEVSIREGWDLEVAEAAEVREEPAPDNFLATLAELLTSLRTQAAAWLDDKNNWPDERGTDYLAEGYLEEPDGNNQYLIVRMTVQS